MATRKKKTVKKRTKKVGKAARARSVKAGKRSVKPQAKTTSRASKAKAKKTAGKSSPKSTRAVKSKASGDAAPANRDAATTVKEKPAPRAAKASEVAKSSATRRHSAFYITTAIAYPNGAPHIGHAYEAIATDALARFQRLDGRDVFFLTGTDEHGLKMIQTAEAEKLSPMVIATRNAQRFKEMDERLNISFDRFIRTTEEQHHRASQEIWRRMAASDDIYLDRYSGW